MVRRGITDGPGHVAERERVDADRTHADDS
jgi:hypothetical protein